MVSGVTGGGVGIARGGVMSTDERSVTEPGVNSLSVDFSDVSSPPSASLLDVCSPGAGLLDVGSLGVGLLGVGLPGVDLLSVGPLGVDLLDIGSLGVDSSGIDLLGVGLLGITGLLDGVDSVGNVNVSVVGGCVVHREPVE